MLRVALLDRHPTRLDGLRARLEADPERDVVSLLTVPALWRRMRGFRPHAVVLAHPDGLAICRDLKCGDSAPAVVLVTPWGGPSFTLAAHAAGADGIVAATAPAQHMLELTEAAAAGEAALPGIPRDGDAASLDRLEDDDLPVLTMLLDGPPPAPGATLHGGARAGERRALEGSAGWRGGDGSRSARRRGRGGDVGRHYRRQRHARRRFGCAIGGAVTRRGIRTRPSASGAIVSAAPWRAAAAGAAE